MSRKVTFSVSTGYVGSRREETYKLEDLGIIESEYETEQELEKAVGEAYEEWIWESIDSTWYFED
ncbi:DUF7167 family protein [Lysinibacillus sp. NPDC093712]|uniref:DUF7167 family protein n=1 Tax=Lysinibacillus sp. NPDC093712 TaxID=3390579 RepID=UPI003D0235F3